MPSTCNAITLLLLLLIISCCSTYLLLVAQAKPLNQNQVRFRRLPPKEFSAQLSSSITIECEAGGAPPPTIHWLKDGKPISQGVELAELAVAAASAVSANNQASPPDNINRISLSATRARLFIDCADYSDEATYTCVAENAYSRIASHTKLNLMKPPAAEVEPTGSAGTENELDGGAGSSGGGGGGGDGGGANGPKSLSAMSQCLSQQLRSGSRPPAEQARIHMWTHNMLEVMGNNVLLYCRSNLILQQLQLQQQQQQQRQQMSSESGMLSSINKELEPELLDGSMVANNNNNSNKNKKPQVSWTLPNEKPVSAETKDRYEILETGDLLIKDLRWEDMGQYVCTVSDEQSSDSITTFVYPAAVKPIKSKRAAAAAVTSPALSADFRWMNQ